MASVEAQPSSSGGDSTASSAVVFPAWKPSTDEADDEGEDFIHDRGNDGSKDLDSTSNEDGTTGGSRERSSFSQRGGGWPRQTTVHCSAELSGSFVEIISSATPLASLVTVALRKLTGDDGVCPSS